MCTHSMVAMWFIILFSSLGLLLVLWHCVWIGASLLRALCLCADAQEERRSCAGHLREFVRFYVYTSSCGILCDELAPEPEALALEFVETDEE